MNHLRRLLVMLMLGWNIQASGGDLPQGDDYAWGFELALQEGGDFYSVPVPLPVYQSVSDPHLRDAGVYNATGQPVPRLFVQPEPLDDSVETRIPLALVPVHGEQDEQADRLRVLLQQSPSTITLEVEGNTPGAPAIEAPVEPLQSYIVDTANLGADFSSLEFHWPASDKGIIGQVRVTDSEDLRSWRGLGLTTLADLQLGDTRIEQRRMALERPSRRYLRITWNGMPADWQLLELSGIRTQAVDSGERDWLTLESSGAGESDRDYLYDAGGFPPVDRVKLLLDDANAVVRAGIFYRENGQDVWRLYCNAVFYNITRDDNALHSPPAKATMRRAAEWMIRLESGTTATAPRLQIGWQPDRLLFIAQGKGPFSLRTGRAMDASGDYPQQRLMGDPEIFRLLRKSGLQGVATLGDRYTVAGPGQLEVRPGSTWRMVLLWAGLLIAVLFVGWLVLSLAREMRRA